MKYLLALLIITASLPSFADVIRLGKGDIVNISGPTYSGCESTRKNGTTQKTYATMEVETVGERKIQISIRGEGDSQFKSNEENCSKAEQVAADTLAALAFELQYINLGDTYVDKTTNPVTCSSKIIDIFTALDPKASAWRIHTINVKCP